MTEASGDISSPLPPPACSLEAATLSVLRLRHSRAPSARAPLRYKPLSTSCQHITPTH
jgi:hypothetical protein